MKKPDYKVQVGDGKLLPYNIKMINSSGDRIDVDIMIAPELLKDVEPMMKEKGMKLISLTRLDK